MIRDLLSTFQPFSNFSPKIFFPQCNINNKTGFENEDGSTGKVCIQIFKKLSCKPNLTKAYSELKIKQ